MLPLLNYLKTGGGLMIPIIIVAFLLWQRYFAASAALKSGCPAELVTHELRFMAALVAAAPLLGLLGTVTGMIHTFRLITFFGVGDARLLADGISEALVTTEAGLCVAIPALLCHAWLTRLARRHATALETEISSLVSENGTEGT